MTMGDISIRGEYAARNLDAKYKLALTDSERSYVNKHPEEATKYAILALFRTEGNLLVAPHDVFYRPDKNFYFIENRQVPSEIGNVLENADTIYSRLSQKYDWLGVIPGNPADSSPDVLFILRDEEKLFKHFDNLKRSDLLKAKLQRCLVEMIKHGMVRNVLREMGMAAKEGEQDVHFSIANVTAHLWYGAALWYLDGAGFDKTFAEYANSGPRYKVGDVLKAMADGNDNIKQAIYNFFTALDPENRKSERERSMLRAYKRFAQQAKDGNTNSPFYAFFEIVGEAGRTARQLGMELSNSKSRIVS